MSEGKVTGIGGIFFHCEDPAKTKAWYHEHFGIGADQYGHSFIQRSDEDPEKRILTQWSPMASSSDYFKPSSEAFMINYRVDDLKALLTKLHEAGIEQVGEMEEYSYGKFAWVIDLDGRKIELWEPIDAPLIDPEADQS